VDLLTFKGENDSGCGDLADLRKIIDWAADARLAVVNLLPLSPHLEGMSDWLPADVLRRIATEAIDVCYLSCAMAGDLTDVKMRADHKRASMALNKLSAVDVRGVQALKRAYLDNLYLEIGAEETRKRSFKTFVEQNAAWLKPFAAYLLLLKINDGAPTQKWGLYGKYEPALIERFMRGRSAEAKLIYYVQYELRRQLRHMADYAAEEGVRLTCDMTASAHQQLMPPHEPWVCEKQIEQQCANARGRCLVPLHDWLLIDGTLNARLSALDGADPLQRMPLTAEALVANRDLSRRIAALLTRAGIA